MATSVRFSSLLTTVDENNNQHGLGYNLGLVRDGDLSAETTVFLRARGLRSNAASRDEDYILAEGPIVFAPEEKMHPVSKALAILPDNIQEGTERVTLLIDRVEGGNIAEPSEAEVLIVDTTATTSAA